MGSKQGKGRYIAGLILIALGGLFLLDTLDVIDFGNIVGWAVSIAFIAFGIGILVTRKSRQVIFPIILILVGVFLLLGNLDVDAYQYWPVILIIIGGAIIFGGMRRQSSRRKSSERKSEVVEGSSATTTSDNEINISCTFSETNERVDTGDFRGGSVNVTMGNVKLDLRDAEVVNRPANLEVSLTMGGLHLRVPSDWGVAIDNSVTLGEVDDKRSHSGPASETPHLKITGNITMGNIEIDD